MQGRILFIAFISRSSLPFVYCNFRAGLSFTFLLLILLPNKDFTIWP